MRKLVVLLLLSIAVPGIAQLPQGVTRIPYPDTHFDAFYLVATPNDVLWTRSALSNGVLRIDLDGRTEDLRFLTVPGSHYRGLTVGPDGAVWVPTASVLNRIDPSSNQIQVLSVGSNREVSSVESGRDGALWVISRWSVSRMRTDGTQLSAPSMREGASPTGSAFGTDGALYLVTTVNGQLERIAEDGSRTFFPADTRRDLHAGTGFLWSSVRQQTAPQQAPATEIVKLSYTGQTLAKYTLSMSALASDSLGNLWLRTTTEDGDFVGQLSPSGMLTKYGPIPSFAVTECFPRWYGGLTFLSDGRVAMADHFPDVARPLISPCVGTKRPAGQVNVITIVDPRLAPIASIELLTVPPRRRAARR